MKKIQEIWLRQVDVMKLYDWVDENEPNEACALLVGEIKQDIAFVEEIILTPNTSKSPVAFQIDPELLLKIIEDAMERKKMLVSIFHSHPLGPYPSGIDIPYMRYNLGTVWLIKEVPKTLPMRGFQWFEDEIIEVKVKITR